MKRILITGGCGFIGHHLVEHLLKNTTWQINILDRLSYASNGLNRLRDIRAFNENRVRIFTANLELGITEGLEKEIGEVDYVLHLAAETHVDRSITEPLTFVRANVLGTAQLLEWARRQENLETFLYFSTDEVFGPAPPGTAYEEWSRYNSTNPYSASKAGAEELTLAWGNTFNLPVTIVHVMNAFGERQHPEKFIPLVVKKVLTGESVTIHSNKDKTKPGSRFYIHARNISDGILFLLKNCPASRDKYNIVGEKEVDNLTLAQMIANILDKPLNYELVDFHSSRPGHDLRYALSGIKMAGLGWAPPCSFESSLEKTIRWMVDPAHATWLYEVLDRQQ